MTCYFAVHVPFIVLFPTCLHTGSLTLGTLSFVVTVLWTIPNCSVSLNVNNFVVALSC